MIRCARPILVLLLAVSASAAVREKPTPPLHCSHAVIQSVDGSIRAELRVTPRRTLDRLDVDLTRIDAVALAPEQPASWSFESIPAGETRSVVLHLTAPAPEGALIFAYTTLDRGLRLGSGYRLPTAVTADEPQPDESL